MYSPLLLCWRAPISLTAIQVFYAGLSEILVNDSSARLAIVVRNTSDLLGFFECELPPSREQDLSTAAPDLILQRLLDYRNSKNSKFAGVALPRTVSEKCPSLCSKLWKELDAVPFVIARESHPRTQADQGELATFAGWEEKHIDEQADSMVRKCIRLAPLHPFFPLSYPRLAPVWSDLTQLVWRGSCSVYSS